MAEAGEWVVLNLDEKMAKRHGMPAQLPMPKERFEELGVEGLSHEMAQRWVKAFLGVAGPTLRQKQPQDAKRYEAYLSKMQFWKDAQKAFEKQDLAQAIKQLSVVCTVDKDDYAAKQNLATSYAAAGRHDEAQALFEQIADIWSGVPDYHVAFANVLMIKGDRDQALEHFVSALEADGECRAAMDGLVSLGFLVKIYEDPLDAGSVVFVRKDSVLEYLEGQWKENPPDAEHYLRVAGYHEDEQRYDVMLAAAERAQSAAPDRVEALLAKTRALRHLKRTEEAKAALASAAEDHPASATLIAELAQCERDLGHVDEARSLIQRALDIDPSNLTALQLQFLPENNTSLEAVQRALPSVTAFSEAHPNSAGAWRMLGRLRARASNESGADDAFQRALELSPDDEDLRVEYWNELVRRGEFATIIRDAEALGEMAQRDWRLRWSEADAFNGLGKKLEARMAYAAINADEKLHIAVRARAKRAVESLG